jgi:hypothetical protein
VGAVSASVKGRRVVLPLPKDGIQLPVGQAGDFSAWAASVAHSLLAGQAGQEQIDGFAAMLLQASADSSKRGADMAFVWAPYPLGGEAARIEVRDYVASPMMPQLPELSEVVEWLSSPVGGATQKPEVVYGQLPLGPAARLKFEVLAPVDEDEDASVLKNTVYIVRPREYDCLVMMNVTWYSGVFTEELDELADTLAQRMQIQ